MSEYERREYIVVYDCDGDSMWDVGTRERVVRCRDCKHSYLFDMSWKSPKTDDKRYCKYGSYLQYEVPNDGFCAWGVSRDSNKGVIK